MVPRAKCLVISKPDDFVPLPKVLGASSIELELKDLVPAEDGVARMKEEKRRRAHIKSLHLQCNLHFTATLLRDSYRKRITDLPRNKLTIHLLLE